MKTPLCVLLSAIALFSAVTGATSEMGNDILTTTVTRERLGSMLAGYSRTPIDVRELRVWVDRLSDKQVVKTDSSFNAPLQVRDVAVVVLDAITGSHFSTPKQAVATPVKEIVSWRDNETVWRFHIPVLTDAQFEQVASNVVFWVEGYEAGAQKQGGRKRLSADSRP